MNGSSASAIFVLSNLDLHGDVPTGTGRLIDVLNDQNTRFLKLENVRVLRRGQSEAISELPTSIIVKSNIHLALLVGEDRPNYTKVFYATLERKTFTCAAALPSMLVAGKIHVKMAGDPQSFLSLEAGSYFPITAAKIHFADTSEVLESPVVLVNKNLVSSLAFH